MVVLLASACGDGDTTVDAAVDARRGTDSCFAAGTPIATPTGDVAIEDLRVGQAVYAYDTATGRVVSSSVTRLWRHVDRPYGTLQLGSGSPLHVTDNHPVYRVNDGSYVAAGQLAVGDTLMYLELSQSPKPLALPTSWEPVSRRGTVYNITVAGHHNYFAAGVLVHNKSPFINLVVSPTNHGFGSVSVGDTGTRTVFSVTNEGDATTSTMSTTMGGVDPQHFVLGPDSCDGRTLAAGATCTVDVAFTPAGSGAFSTDLTVMASTGGTATAVLTGTGTSPLLDASVK